jgi:hypothetical protein
MRADSWDSEVRPLHRQIARAAPFLPRTGQVGSSVLLRGFNQTGRLFDLLVLNRRPYIRRSKIQCIQFFAINPPMWDLVAP